MNSSNLVYLLVSLSIATALSTSLETIVSTITSEFITIATSDSTYVSKTCFPAYSYSSTNGHNFTFMNTCAPDFTYMSSKLIETATGNTVVTEIIF